MMKNVKQREGERERERERERRRRRRGHLYFIPNKQLGRFMEEYIIT